MYTYSLLSNLLSFHFLFHDFYAFKVSVEKVGIILIGLHLYVTWPFSSATVSILFCFVDSML